MFSLETFFDRISFAVFAQSICLFSAIFGIAWAAKYDKCPGVVKFLSKLATKCFIKTPFQTWHGVAKRRRLKHLHFIPI